MLTLRERWGTLRGRTLAFVGDGNNVATRWRTPRAMLGVHVHVASAPTGYELPDAVVAAGRRRGARTARGCGCSRDPADAVAGADAVYTDVWASMGQEAEADARAERLRALPGERRLMALAKPGALFMHCLPAHRGEEVTDEVIESPASVVFDQAENRLHAQKALLVMLLGRRVRARTAIAGRGCRRGNV